MIVGRCSNSTAGYGAAGEQREPVAQKGPHADNDAANGKEMVAQGMFIPRTARSNRPDASFVVQLIAAAEQIPQTRALRRASVADAMSYYDAVTKVASSGNRMTRTGFIRVA